MTALHEAIRVALVFAGLYHLWKSGEHQYDRKAYGIALVVLGSLP